MAPFLDVEMAAQGPEEEAEEERSPLNSARVLVPANTGVVRGSASRWVAAAAVLFLLVGTAVWAVGGPLNRTGGQHEVSTASTEVLAEDEDHGHEKADIDDAGQKPTVTSLAAKIYDCSAGADDWEHNWKKDEKEYCCQSVNVGCETNTWKMVIIIGAAVIGLFSCMVIGTLIAKKNKDAKRAQLSANMMGAGKPGKERCCSCFGRDERSGGICGQRDTRSGWGWGKSNNSWFGGGGNSWSAKRNCLGK